MLTVAVPPPTLIVTGTLVGRSDIAGHLEGDLLRTVTLPTEEIGAKSVIDVTVSDATVLAQGPKLLELSTRF